MDLKIETCLQREQEIPKQKKKYDIHRKRLKAELEESEARCKHLQVEQKNCEGEIQDKQLLIGKYETQLLAVKKNDEYQALLHEIDLVKKQVSAKEERIIALMVEGDESTESLEEDKKRIDSEQKSIEAECKKIDAELSQAVEQRAKLEKDRLPLEQAVDRSILNRYKRIRKSKGHGAAVVALNGESCSGCFMLVTPQIINELMAGEKVHACQHCGRILFHPDFDLGSATENVEAS